ncbi:nucleotidyltransferase domain-containing protein [Yoonia sp. SS1-5]|uniref:Nucleotidyltransferase domain-containing protein n=1 Tax=Yoonia rhodophyticola TaxID=3137370 RepID=A0AAN0M7I9_9RHOB
MDHPEIIQTITDAIITKPQIRALFLGGSYGTGMADAYSDIDFVIVTPEGATDDIAAIWQDAIAQTGEIVLWWDRKPVPVLINAITDDWTRTDVMILKPDQMGAQSQANLRPLFDHDGIHDRLKERPAPTKPDLKKAKYQFEEFIRILGLLHLVVGRKEYINGVLGVFHLRNLLVDLLIQETDAPHRGGQLHLNRLITDEQKALLVALPPPVADRDQLIAAHLAYAKAYLPRARKRAAKLGIAWPDRFETATWAKLHADLGTTRPYDPVQ